MDYAVHGILQARILEWVACPFSKGSSQPRDQTQVSSITGSRGKVGLKLGFLSGPLMVYLKVLSLRLFSMGDGEQFNSQGICLRDQNEKIKMHFKINSFQCCSGRGAHWDLYKQLVFCFNISGGCWWCGWSLWRARGFLKTSCFAYMPCQSKSKSWMRFWP